MLHFIQNQNVKSMNFTNIKKTPSSRSLGPKTQFCTNWAQKTYVSCKRFTLCKSRTLVPIYTNKSSFLQNVKLNKLHILNDKICLQLGVQNLKSNIGSLDSKDLPSHKSTTLLSVFTNKASFYPESKGESNNLLKY